MTSSTKVEHNNCFDLIRHLAALAVLYSHHFALSGLPEPGLARAHSWGGIAVIVFFAISGYLVSRSFSRSSNFIDYLAKRSLRIFPAIFICSAITLYGIAYTYSNSSFISWALNLNNLKSLFAMTMFVPPILPGVFPDFIVPNAINGSLWTLPIEFSLYLATGIALTLANSYRSSIALLLILITSYYLTAGKSEIQNIWSTPLVYYFQFGISFVIGSILAQTESAWNTKQTKICIFLASLIAVFSLSYQTDYIPVVHIAIPMMVIIAGTSIKDRLISGRFDISYGIYIYAFPVQQIIINKAGLSFWTSMFVATAITIALAALSWRLVEKPCLSLKKKTPQKSGIDFRQNET